MPIITKQSERRGVSAVLGQGGLDDDATVLPTQVHVHPAARDEGSLTGVL